MIRRLLLSYCLLLAGIVCIAQQPHAQLGHFPPGVIQQRTPLDASSGFTPSCTPSSTFLAAATGVTTTGDKQNYDTLICGLNTDGNLAGMDVLYIWAAPVEGSTASLINLANPGTFDGTTHGTKSFSAYNGYTGDGSTFYIDSGFNPSTATSPNFVQNSATVGVYDLTSRACSSNQWQQGNIGAGAAGNLLELCGNTGQFAASINSGTSITNTNTNPVGAWNLTRTISSSEVIYLNSSETTSGNTSDTSQAPNNSNHIFFAFNAAFGWTGDKMAAGWIGKGVSAVNSCKINNRINTYLQFVTGGGSDIRVYTNSAC